MLAAQGSAPASSIGVTPAAWSFFTTLTNSSHVLGASRPCVGEDGLVVVDERDDLGVGRRNVDLSMDSVAAGKDEVLVQPGLVEWQQQPGFEEILGVDRGEHVRELPACLELLGIGVAIGGRRDDLLDR